MSIQQMDFIKYLMNNRTYLAAFNSLNDLVSWELSPVHTMLPLSYCQFANTKDR